MNDFLKTALADIESDLRGSDRENPTKEHAGLHHSGLSGKDIPKHFSADHRQAFRYGVNWKIAVIFEDQEHKPTYHGRTHDLSLTGTGMLTATNLTAATPVIILLAPPPLHVGHRQKLIEIRARQQYSVYSGETRCWRLGFAFLEFKNNGFNILRDRLLHHQPITRVPAVKMVF